MLPRIPKRARPAVKRKSPDEIATRITVMAEPRKQMR